MQCAFLVEVFFRFIQHPWFRHILLGAMTKFRKATISSIVSVRLFVRLASYRMDFH